MADNFIGLNIGGNAPEQMNKIGNATEQTAASFKSAKAELRALQAQMGNLDVNSKEFAVAAERAGKLKDQLNDAADAVKGSTGPAFESMNNTFGIMGQQIMNLDFDGVGQSLTSLSRSVSKINLKTIKDELGGLMTGLGNMAKALLSNPIFLIGAAVASVIVYWKELNTAFEDLTMNAEVMNKRLMQSEQVISAMGKANVTANNLRLLTKAVNDHNLSQEVRQQALDKINVALKENNITTVDNINNTNQLATSTEQLTQKLFKQAEVQGKMAYLQDLWAQKTKIQADLSGGLANTLYEYSFGLDKLATDLVGTTQADLDSVNKQIELVEQQLTANGDYVNELNISTTTAAKETTKAVEKSTVDILEQNAIRAAAQLKQERDIADAAQKVREEYAKANMSAQANELYALEQKLNSELDSFIGSEEEKVFIIEKYRKLEQDINDKYDAEAQKAIDEQNEKRKADLDAEWERDMAFAEKQKKQRQEKYEQEKFLHASRVQMSTDAIGALIALNDSYSAKSEETAKRQFQIGKALSLAQAIISTYQAVNQQLAVPQDALTGANFVKAGIALAAGLANVIKISSTQFKSSSTPSAGGAPSLGSSGGGGSTQPTSLSLGFLNNQPQQQQPFQAYVIGSQVNTAIEAQALIRNQARLH